MSTSIYNEYALSVFVDYYIYKCSRCGKSIMKQNQQEHEMTCREGDQSPVRQRQNYSVLNQELKWEFNLRKKQSLIGTISEKQ